jgi:[ribosomal protein S5]-alanine N-acetyltransferase
MAFEIIMETGRLFLRRFAPDDAPLLHALDSDPEVMRYISKIVPTPLEVIQQVVLPRWLSFYERYDDFGFWAAHLRSTQEFIGWFHLKVDPAQPAVADLGYRLHRSQWRKGYATEASTALLRKAFLELDIEKVTAHTLVGNAASRRVMEKVGLRYERSFIVAEQVLPGWSREERRAVRYALIRKDFFRSGDGSEQVISG